MRGGPALFVVAWLFVLLGCAPTKAARIHELELPEASARGNPLWADQSILVRRFDEARPPRYSKAFATTFMVPLNLVHAGGSSEYAEHAGGYVTKKGVHVGWLPVELPMLLQRGLPGENAVVADDLPAGIDRDWDYVVEGRLLTTRLTEHRSFLLALLSVLGTPPFVYIFELEFELALYGRDSVDVPIFRKTYAYRRRQAEGLWYHHGTAQQLKRESLAATVDRATRDLVREVTLHAARRDRNAS